MNRRPFSKIPTKLIKVNTDILSYSVSVSFNNNVNAGVLTDKQKHAGMKTFYEKELRNGRRNFRPASNLQSLSKSFENCMQDEHNNCFNKILSKHQCSFR